MYVQQIDSWRDSAVGGSEFEVGERQQVSNRQFRFRLALFTVLTGAGAAATLAGSGWSRLPGQVLLGVMFAHALELQHQCLHGTGLATAAGNRWVGRLVGAPMLVSYSHYRARHLRHHRYLGTDRDTEFFQYAALEDLSVRGLLSSAFNVRRYGTFVRTAWRALRGERMEDWTEPADDAAIRREYVALAALVLVVVPAASVLTGSPVVLVLWLVPLLFAEPAHTLIELPEHIGCDTTSRDPLRNTRTIVGSRFSYWLTNGNNFHVEHHWKQWLPISELPVLHRSVKDDIEVLVPTYWAFYRQIAAAVVARPTTAEEAIA
ncbi:MAG: fatty acid desaturase [Actinomycetota bacterium]|nr:fatty acid desaturase [Actinomycetota bacterium]